MRADPTSVAPDRPLAADAARRRFVTHGTLVGFLLAGGIVSPAEARSADASPFEATLLSDVMRSLGETPVASSAIDLDVPELTENGAMVPIAVTSRLPRTTRILLLADANPFPLVATFDIVDGTEPYISTRVKIAQTCMVRAVVRADGRLYTAARETAVLEGGCGG